MEIISKLDKSQFYEVKKLYTDFFRSINFNNDYSDKLINNFANKKSKDVFCNEINSKYIFALVDDKIIGFIHGKIVDGIGLISHAYVKPEYRKHLAFTLLYKHLLKWFKENDIKLIETEVNKQNKIYKNLERNSWHIDRNFDDASVFIRKV